MSYNCTRQPYLQLRNSGYYFRYVIPDRLRRFVQRSELKYIKQHEEQHPTKVMCRVLGVQRSGYYAWKKQPVSAQAKDNQRLLGHIKQSWLESGCVYGYRKVHDDMMDLNETCSENRVYRLMHNEGIKAQVGYKKHRYSKGGEPSVVAPNHLKRQFDVKEPNTTWVTDITYIRTYEG